MPPYADDNMYSNNTDDNIIQSLLVRNNESTTMMTSLSSQSIFATPVLTAIVPHKKKKSVSFAKRVRAKKIAHINDIKKAMNINNIWYSSDELYKIRLECISIVDRMNTLQEKNVSCDTDMDNTQQQEQCTVSGRGLEKYTTLERENSQRRKSNVIEAVLEEQDFQRSLGMNEPEILASASMLNSYESQTLAHSIATQDY